MKKFRLQNEIEASQAKDRDRQERQALIQSQLKERRRLQTRIKAHRASQSKELEALNADVARYMLMGGKEPIEQTRLRPDERDRERRKRLHSSRDQDRGQGPETEPQ